MIKRISIILLLFGLGGCASTNIAHYIQGDYPYQKKFYSSFEEVLEATQQTLEEFGWTISKTTDPFVFERDQAAQEEGRQILILTEIRQTPMFIGSRYARLNIYLRTATDNSTEVEIRYLTASSIFFKTFYNYKNDSAVERLFDHIEELLSSSKESKSEIESFEKTFQPSHPER